MIICATALQNDLYKLLDQVLATRQPLQIERNGRILEITPKAKHSKLSQLSKHDCLIGDPEEIVHVVWSGK